jgi:hypothetical protein
MTGLLLTPGRAESPHRWDRLGSLPRRGWRLTDVEDLGEPGHECDACGTTEIRYVHRLDHPEAERSLEVGCVCAEKLTGDYVAHRMVERALKNRAVRLAKLLDLDKWKWTKGGNRKARYRGTVLVLYQSQFTDGWRINVGTRLADRTHPTPEGAIIAAFASIDPPKAEKPDGRKIST